MWLSRKERDAILLASLALNKKQAQDIKKIKKEQQKQEIATKSSNEASIDVVNEEALNFIEQPSREMGGYLYSEKRYFRSKMAISLPI